MSNQVPIQIARAPEAPSTENTFFGTIEVEEISIARWRTIFDSLGYPKGLSRSTLSLPAISGALIGQPITGALFDLLHVNFELGTNEGRDAILEAAAEQKIDTRSWPKDEAPRELAARVWLEQRSDPALAKVVERALMCASGALGTTRRYRQFGGEARPLRDPVRFSKALRRDLAAWCKETHRGDYAEVRVCELGGAVHFELLHGHRIVNKVVVEAKRRTTISLRPAHSDVVRYEPATGRLGIAAGSAAATDFYRGLFGRVIFGDPTYFQSGRFCTLDPLKQGRRAFDGPLDPRILRARLVGFVWRAGADDPERYQVTGKDCFRALAATKQDSGEGELLEATIKLEIKRPGGRPRTKRIRIKVPDHLGYERDGDELLVEEFLRTVGFTSRGLGLDDVASFWDLHPWTHSIARWRRSFGGNVDQMVAQGLLVPVERERAEHPDQPHVPAPLRVERLADGEVHGVSEDDDVPSITLRPCDLDGLRIDISALARSIASGLGLTGRVADLDGDAAVFNLGSRDFGGQAIRVFFLARRPRNGAAVGQRLQAVGGGARVVVIVPEGTAQTGNPEVELGAPCGPFARLLRPLVEAARLQPYVAANLYAPAGARLIVDRLHGIWVDGRKIDGLAADGHPARLLATLAGANGRPIPLDKLLEAVESMEATPKEAIRKLKKRTLDPIRKTFSAAGLPPPVGLEQMIARRGDAYVLTYSSYLA